MMRAERVETSLESPKVELKRCTGCGRCVSACPEKLFTLEVAGYRKYAALRSTTCGRCLKCFDACPVGALSVPPDAPQPESD